MRFRRYLIPLAALALMAAAPSASARPTQITVNGGMQPGGLARGAGSNISGTSQNWSGLVVSGGADTFTSVSGSWVEPTATCSSGNQYASFWVGLDGWSGRTVEQTGSDADCNGSTPAYHVWYEMYPSPPVYFSNPVSPGDELMGSVTYDGLNTFTIVLTDVQKGWTRTLYPGEAGAARASAEVIAEAPGNSNGILPLTDFGAVHYGIAYVNGKKITSFSPTIVTMVDPYGFDKDRVTITELGNFWVTWLMSS